MRLVVREKNELFLTFPRFINSLHKNQAEITDFGSDVSLHKNPFFSSFISLDFSYLVPCFLQVFPPKTFYRILSDWNEVRRTWNIYVFSFHDLFFPKPSNYSATLVQKMCGRDVICRRVFLM